MNQWKQSSTQCSQREFVTFGNITVKHLKTVVTIFMRYEMQSISSINTLHSSTLIGSSEIVNLDVLSHLSSNGR